MPSDPTSSSAVATPPARRRHPVALTAFQAQKVAAVVSA